MEQQFNTPHPPLLRAPLKMRGIFGVAWELYRRGFWQMFALAMLTLGRSCSYSCLRYSPCSSRQGY